MSARILVVDDVPINVRLLHAKLSAEYFDVVTAEDGPSALAAMADEPPDIVLLDVMMPGMTGFEVCRRIKANPRWTHIPVVMVTALDLPEDRVEGLEAGADEFLTKPVNDVALFARVRSLVRLKRVMDEWRMREETKSRLGMLQDGDTLAAEPGDKARVLLAAEDDRLIRRLTMVLEQDNHQIAVADLSQSIPDQALRHNADLLVLDLHRENGDALRICSQVRSHERTRHLPMLIMGYEPEMPRLIKGLELGVNDYLLKPLDANELRARVRTQVKRRRFQLRIVANHEASLALALTDGLTGLYNRHYFNAHFQGLFRNAQEQARPISVMMVDADHFKAVNDTHGHAAGDEVLKGIAGRLANGIRHFDLAARLGGEEFVVVMPECRLSEAEKVGERLRQAIATHPFTVTGVPGGLTVTASFGLATAFATGDTPEAILERADQALYEAKRSGRNRVVSYTAAEKHRPASASNAA